MRVCSHIVTNDTGLAPNPFHGFCTTALCTPSHMRLQLEPGEWLIGHSRKREGFRLVYAMKIAEVLTMNRYFEDPRFQAKKPVPNGPVEAQCGDNLYFRDTNGRWTRIPSRFHNDRDCFISDVGRDRTGRPVFVARHFFYFGRSTVAIPAQLGGIIRSTQGAKFSDAQLAQDFVGWLEANHEPGRRDLPRDFSDKSGEVGPMLTSLDE